MMKRIGILGGGQLGLMLCEAARPLGLETTVVTPDADAPAAQLADHVLVESLENPEIAGKLAAHTDVVTFEIEAIPAPLLDALEQAERDGRIHVRPSIAVLRLIQNKALQKDWLLRHGLPTLPCLILSGDDMNADALVRRFGLPFVQKAQRGGYDGRGVQIIRRTQDLAGLWPIPSVVEPFEKNIKEIAVVIARGVDGQISCYEPVGMTFNDEHNILEFVTSPSGLSAELSGKARQLGTEVVSKLGGIGIFSIEMFLTQEQEQELLINEIAPRVHNSGHHTLQACPSSQFEQHLRAVAGMSLGAVEPSQPAVMRNLLYDDSMAALCSERPGPLRTKQVQTFPYWYGKREGRALRKMGHITALGPQAQARAAIEAALKELTAPGREAAA